MTVVLKDCETIALALHGHHIAVTGGTDIGSVPTVEITLDIGHGSVTDFCLRLQRGTPGIALDPAQRDRGIVTVNPMCLKPGEAELVGREVARALG